MGMVNSNLCYLIDLVEYTTIQIRMGFDYYALSAHAHNQAKENTNDVFLMMLLPR
jgi:hypothetical protein